MIHKPLICHNKTLPTDIKNITATVSFLPTGDLHLRYQLIGNVAQLLIPKPQKPTVIDGLWKHTCFELFIAVEGESNYHEFNFSPSGQWATYAFSDYRIQSERSFSPTQQINFAQTNTHLLLDVVIAQTDLPQNPSGKLIQLGITAVIEAIDGDHSYWALHHPLTHPDFHHRAGFILPLNLS